MEFMVTNEFWLLFSPPEFVFPSVDPLRSQARTPLWPHNGLCNMQMAKLIRCTFTHKKNVVFCVEDVEALCTGMDGYDLVHMIFFIWNVSEEPTLSFYACVWWSHFMFWPPAGRCATTSEPKNISRPHPGCKANAGSPETPETTSGWRTLKRSHRQSLTSATK